MNQGEQIKLHVTYKIIDRKLCNLNFHESLDLNEQQRMNLRASLEWGLVKLHRGWREQFSALQNF